jgi:hypothetical protein
MVRKLQLSRKKKSLTKLNKKKQKRTLILADSNLHTESEDGETLTLLKSSVTMFLLSESNLKTTKTNCESML